MLTTSLVAQGSHIHYFVSLSRHEPLPIHFLCVASFAFSSSRLFCSARTTPRRFSHNSPHNSKTTFTQYHNSFVLSTLLFFSADFCLCLASLRTEDLCGRQTRFSCNTCETEFVFAAVRTLFVYVYININVNVYHLLRAHNLIAAATSIDDSARLTSSSN